MKILAFDTSSTALSLALLEDQQVLADFTLNIKKNHSISLMPAIDFILQSVGLAPADLDRIVVAKGPGSYTGLRVAVATAKTLAYSLGIDLVGASSLASLAAPIEAPGLIIPLMDARRNNVYAGFYDNGVALLADRHMAFEEVLEVAKAYEQVTFVGEVANFIQQIEEVLPEAAIKHSLPSAAGLAQLVFNQPAEDVHSFVPDYLKRVEAEENWLKTNQETNADNYIKRV